MNDQNLKNVSKNERKALFIGQPDITDTKILFETAFKNSKILQIMGTLMYRGGKIAYLKYQNEWPKS